MDNLGNLSSDLPKDDTLSDTNTELHQQFKQAANSVASLYKITTQRTQQVYRRGYIQALSDILDKIHSAESTEEVEKWVVLKRFELERNTEKQLLANTGSNTAISTTADISPSLPTVGLPSDHVFSMGSVQPAGHAFPPTNPIMTVERRLRRAQKLMKGVVDTGSDEILSIQKGVEVDEDVNQDVEILDTSKRRMVELTSMEKRSRHEDLS